MDQMLSVLTGVHEHEHDHFAPMQLSVAKCAGCLCDILDASLIRVGLCDWHEACVKCLECQAGLTDSCFERDGKLYCKMHYYRKFSNYRCSGCGEGVSPSDLVYRVSNELLFHTHCHCCTHCGRMLVPGSKILVDHEQQAISCYEHYENYSAPSTQEVSNRETPNLEVFMSDSRSSPVTFSPTAPAMYSDFGACDYYGGYNSDDPNCKYLKRRGPRTTIKQSQLDVLNRIFTATPKPSKHARAKLALETGLSMRVIQVWFQNRRSKERRLKHLCNWIRANENRGLIPAISPMGSGSSNKGSNRGQSVASGMASSSQLASSSSSSNQRPSLFDIKCELACKITVSEESDEYENDI